MIYDLIAAYLLTSCIQDHYGVDWEGPIPEVDSEVHVPDINVPLSDSDLVLLQCRFPEEVILASDYHAVDVYSEVMQFVNEHMSIIIELTLQCNISFLSAKYVVINNSDIYIIIFIAMMYSTLILLLESAKYTFCMSSETLNTDDGVQH